MKISESISETLRNNFDKRSKEFWSKYLKNEIEFIGVGIPRIREIVNQIIFSYEVKMQDDYLSIAYSLLVKPVAEEKLAAILILQENSKNIDNKSTLDFVDKIFSEKLVFDWNTCDWLCVRILTPIIDNGNFKYVKRISDWYKNEYLWQARASLVSFAQSNKLSDYIELLHKPMIKLIKRDEKFSKSAVGWLLREISKSNNSLVVDFLIKYSQYLNIEVINNSLKYFSKEDKLTIKQDIKETASNTA